MAHSSRPIATSDKKTPGLTEQLLHTDTGELMTLAQSVATGAVCSTTALVGTRLYWSAEFWVCEKGWLLLWTGSAVWPVNEK